MMIEKRTTKQIISYDAELRTVHYAIQTGETRDNFNNFNSMVWVGLESLKKEIEEIEQSADMQFSDGKYMYNKSERLIVLEITGLLKSRLCNSQEQSPSQSTSVSCEHKTTGEDKKSVIMSNNSGSSPVQNPCVHNEMTPFIERENKIFCFYCNKEFIRNPKKCTCKYGLEEPSDDWTYCCRCGGEL